MHNFTFAVFRITWKDSQCVGKDGLHQAYEFYKLNSDAAKRIHVMMGLCCSRGNSVVVC